MPITVPVMVKSVVIALPVYCNWQTYHTGNVLMCHDSITGVILSITVPVMVKSVAIALPRTGTARGSTSNGNFSVW